MSNYLAIDTSSGYLIVLAQKGTKSVLRHTDNCAMRHSVVLMDEIDAALSEAELTPDECDFFAAVTGPGSFTGIRIGISAAKGFALAAGKPLKPVTAFDMLAYNVNSKNFYIAIDAAHGYYYVCGYKDGEICLAPCYMSGEDVELLKTPVFGFEDLNIKGYTRLDVRGCLKTAVECCNILSDSMHALYVRKSQAEEALCANKRMEL